MITDTALCHDKLVSDWTGPCQNFNTGYLYSPHAASLDEVLSDSRPDGAPGGGLLDLDDGVVSDDDMVGVDDDVISEYVMEDDCFPDVHYDHKHVKWLKNHVHDDWRRVASTEDNETIASRITEMIPVVGMGMYSFRPTLNAQTFMCLYGAC